MDSKTVDKLIRSEAWPILRSQGFSQFDSRNAYAYRGCFINVVNFQSFNSYLAGGLGCTTYSFALNLGVYVVGRPGERHRRRDKAGKVRPYEPECSFRKQLKKRTPVDGFERDDIFFISEDGSTAFSCFEEVRHLLNEPARYWFQVRNDLSELIIRMEIGPEPSVDPGIALGCARSGSYSWNELKSQLLLIKHSESPNHRSASAVLSSLDRTIGELLDISPSVHGLPGDERYVLAMRGLWDRLGDFRPVPEGGLAARESGNCLEGPVWAIESEALAGSGTSPNSKLELSPRRQFWPVLRNLGFSEFTDRLAHRISADRIEVVQILPMDPAERKAWRLPSGLFRVGVGVFWPVLRGGSHFRTIRSGEPRPLVTECHLSNWLVPSAHSQLLKGTAFCSVDDAIHVLPVDGLSWLSMWGQPQSAISLIELDNWEIFWNFPMMRGHGAKQSSSRRVFSALFQAQLMRPAESAESLKAAEAAAETWYLEHLRPRYRDWVQNAKVGIKELAKRDAESKDQTDF